MKLKNLLILLFISIVATASAQLKDYSMFDKKFNFYIANDLGRNGYYDQKPIAELIPLYDTLVLPLLPLFVVTRITPNEALAP